MKDVYLDKKDRLRRLLKPSISIPAAVAVLLFLFLPIWPDFVQGRFVLEPAQRAVLRAEVPGVVTEVLASEDEQVNSGVPLVKLRNVQMNSELGQANAELQESTARATTATLRYADFGTAERQRQEAAERQKALTDEAAHLTITAPMSGTVLTPRPNDLVGTYLPVGSKVLELGDLHTMVARIYIPEYGVRDVRVGALTRLKFSSQLRPISGRLSTLEPVSAAIDPGLVEKAELNGITPPPYYLGEVLIANDGSLREGMTGLAKLFTRRRSLAEMFVRFCRDSVLRRFW